MRRLKEHLGVLLAHHGLKGRGLAADRRLTLRSARGRVLEVGSGTGLNRPHYPASVVRLLGVDTSFVALAKALRSGTQLDHSVVAAGERLPFPDAAFDTVVTTYVMCLVVDPERVAAEIRRVLVRDGVWLFLEHGRSPEERMFERQTRWAMVTKRCCGGCEPTRAITSTIAAAGFAFSEVATYYARGPKPVSYTYRGIAHR